jgi:DNA repair exonuclease SbcCD ATPase subunit
VSKLINFKTIRWKNFLSTGNIFTEVDLSTGGTTLIVGENGAGKSTILDAITFALFGKTFRNINKPQLLNSITRKELVVEIEFLVQQNRYKIIRGMKPGIFEVYCNGSLLNQSAEMRDYQEVLEKNILKINYKSFCQVVILGSASFVPFMQLPAAQRRAIIEDLLDLQVFTTMNTLLKDKVQENGNQLQLNENERRIVEAKIKMVKEHLKEIQSKNEQFIREKKQTIKDIEVKIENAQRERDAIDEKVAELRKQWKDPSSIENRIDKLRGLKTQLDTKVTYLLKEAEFFENHDNCPTCTQVIDNRLRCETVDKKKSEVDQIVIGKEQLETKLSEELLKLKEANKIVIAISDAMKPSVPLSVQINHWADQITSIKEEIKNTTKSVRESTDVKVVDLEKELADLSEQYNRLQEDKQVLNAAAMLLKDGGIKTRIVNQYIPVINKLINKYLSEFDLFVEFNLDEQFNEVIKSRYRDEFSYASFSEGEKQKIDLAILFTWRAVAKLRNSLSTNLLILDEVFDSSLDGQSADDLLKILQNISKDSNVFIISHRDTLHDKFENVIKFVKTKSFSRIAE